jgi:hypothetical protein
MMIKELQNEPKKYSSSEQNFATRRLLLMRQRDFWFLSVKFNW